ncbi:MAG: ribonuclease P protein component 4 [Candidatus Jordarchaeum sp.]|uniref:ribonuclease P protein component 4 n=1 Tax=Candidatus Jordarchaeum sp. TaxID=2823881 RepID=UPI004049D84B
MPVSRRSRKREVEKISRERIDYLLRLADDVFLEKPARAQRYADLSRRIGMRNKVRLPKIWRRRICRNCKAFLWPGVNCRVRLRPRRQSHIVVTCFNCGHHTRYNI